MIRMRFCGKLIHAGCASLFTQESEKCSVLARTMPGQEAAKSLEESCSSPCNRHPLRQWRNTRWTSFLLFCNLHSALNPAGTGLHVCESASSPGSMHATEKKDQSSPYTMPAFPVLLIITATIVDLAFISRRIHIFTDRQHFS